MKNVFSDKVSAGEIPIEILKESTFCFPELTNCTNESLTDNRFPDTSKLSEITPVFKKLHPSDKANYRPVSILPLVSKLFEKFKYDQLDEYIEHFLNELLRGFCEAHMTRPFQTTRPFDTTRPFQTTCPFQTFIKLIKRA